MSTTSNVELQYIGTISVLFVADSHLARKCTTSIVSVLESDKRFKVANWSKDGATAQDGLDILKKQLGYGKEYDVAIFAFGTNDARHKRIPAEDDLEAALKRYGESLMESGRILAERGTEVIICTPPPLRDDKLYDPSDSFVLHERDRIRDFALRAFDVVNQLQPRFGTGVRLADWHAAIENEALLNAGVSHIALEACREAFFVDATHMSEDGHRIATGATSKPFHEATGMFLPILKEHQSMGERS